MRAAALLLTLSLLLAGCSDGYDSGGDRATAPAPDPFARVSEEGVDELNREEVERFGSVKLPANARRLRTFHSRALDTMMLVSFEVDRPDMEQFVADSGFKGGLKTGAMPLAAPEGGQLGWKLHEIKRAAGAEDRTPKGVYRRITVSLDDPERPVVYFMAYTA